MGENNALADALLSCNESDVRTLIRRKVAEGSSAEQIVSECQLGMARLGEKFAAGECFIPQLIVAGTIMKRAMDELSTLSQMPPTDVPSIGTIVMGSVKNDVHDIGKQITNMMLRGVGFRVVDLGVNVAPEKFAEAIEQHKPQLLGMSVLLTTCYSSVVETVKAIDQAGLRKTLSVMVGGAAASRLLAEEAGCDFYGKTAVDGVMFARRLLGVSK